MQCVSVSVFQSKDKIYLSRRKMFGCESLWESAVHGVSVFQSKDRIYPSQGKMFGCEPYCKDFVWFHHKVGEENFYRQYDVKVQALNNMGAGPNTSVEIVMSAEDSEW